MRIHGGEITKIYLLTSPHLYVTLKDKAVAVVLDTHDQILTTQGIPTLRVLCI